MSVWTRLWTSRKLVSKPKTYYYYYYYSIDEKFFPTDLDRADGQWKNYCRRYFFFFLFENNERYNNFDTRNNNVRKKKKYEIRFLTNNILSSLFTTKGINLNEYYCLIFEKKKYRYILY